MNTSACIQTSTTSLIMNAYQRFYLNTKSLVRSYFGGSLKEMYKIETLYQIVSFTPQSQWWKQWRQYWMELMRIIRTWNLQGWNTYLNSHTSNWSKWRTCIIASSTRMTSHGWTNQEHLKSNKIKNRENKSSNF